MRLGWYLVTVVAYMVGAQNHVRAQFSVEQLQKLATNALNIFLDSASSGSSASSRQCIPYKLPNEFTNYQDFCKYLSMKSDDEIDEMFMNGDGPDTGDSEFPLKGCVLGCIIGKESYRRGMSWGSGSWSGKCIRNSHDIINLLTPLPSIGGVMTVQDAFNWSNFLPTLERYPGNIDVDWSWWDAYNALASYGRMSKVWTLTYQDVEIPETGEDGALDDLMSAYPRLVKGSRDEVRLIEPGLMFGQLFRKPNSFLNPTPLPVDSGIRFAMIQVCDGDRFAYSGNTRDL
eukprot:jgi/Picsp_1/1710/NSC_05184-R1_---NA---